MTWQISSHPLKEGIVCPVSVARTPGRKFWSGRGCMHVGLAIMVNGCFWHGHKGCRYATSPKSNIEFWGAKIARNRHRDEVTEAHLLALGWHVITIWECELRGASSADSRIDKLTEEIREAGAALLERMTLHASDRLETQRKTRELMERQARLEAEINALYPIPKKVKMESRTEI